jgi:hypothetical protein
MKKKTFQVRIVLEPEGFVGFRDPKGWRGHHFPLISGVLDEVRKTFAGCNPVLQGHDPKTGHDVYLMVEGNIADLPEKQFMEVVDKARRRWKKLSKDHQAAPKFELTASRTPEVEKRVASGLKNLDLYFNINRRAKGELFGSAFLIGSELNGLAEDMPHGELEATVESRYTLPKSTQYRWRDHAKAVIAKIKELEEAKSPTVGLLKGRPLILSGKKKFSKKECTAILELVPSVMGGKGMVQFAQDVLGVPEADEPGGYNYDPAKLEKWLAKHHPELEGKTYEELPEDVQKEFAKFDLGSRDRRSAHDVAIEQRDLLVKAIVPAVAGKWLMALSAEERAELKLAAAKLMDKLNALDGGCTAGHRSPSPKSSPQGEDLK